jgi:hypothetical protein
MGFLRPIILILFLTGLSLAGLVGLGIIFPDAFVTGTGGFIVYIVGVSLIFLFFLKRYRKGGPSERGQERPPEASTQHSPDKRLEEIRARIRDRKKQEK